MDSAGIPWYSTGTVNVIQGSSNVAGVGTNWVNAGLKVGDIFTIDKSRLYQITAVNSNTSLSLQEAYQGATGSSQVYFVIRNFAGTMQAQIAAQVSELVNKYESYIDTELKKITGPAGPTSFPYRGTWTTGRTYNGLDVVQYGNQLYMALYGHTSTSANAPGATGTAWTGLSLSLSGTALVSRNVTLYVATDGNDSTGDGTAAKPFATINRAIGQLGNVMDNCNILVKPGTYTLVQSNGDYGGDSPIHIEGKQGTLTIRSTNGLAAKDIIFLVTDNRDRGNLGGVVTVKGFVTLTLSGFVIHLTGTGSRQSGLYAGNGGNIVIDTLDIFSHGRSLRFILQAAPNGRIIKQNASSQTLISFDVKDTSLLRSLAMSQNGFICIDHVGLKTPEEGETVYGPQYAYMSWNGGIIVPDDGSINVSPYGAKYYASNYLIYPPSV